MVGSQLLWAAGGLVTGARAPSSTTGGDAAPLTYLGQGHAAEISRARLARAALTHLPRARRDLPPPPLGARRRPRARSWRPTHAPGSPSTPAACRSSTSRRPIVSVFSTGVLEAAARGRDAWVDFPRPPAWLGEFWERYAMHRLGIRAHARPRPARGQPAERIAADRDRGGVVTLCVIPARGGSKGVPRKNLLDVGGKPLIVWTIEQALAVPGPRRAGLHRRRGDRRGRPRRRRARAVAASRRARPGHHPDRARRPPRHRAGHRRARPSRRGDAAAGDLAGAPRRHPRPGAGRVRRAPASTRWSASSSSRRSSGRQATRPRRRTTSRPGRAGRT